jgi:putative transposase
MPLYRRYRVPGSTVFLTLVSYRRRPLFNSDHTIQLLRNALRETIDRWPFTIDAAVILPDHAHFLWTLPDGDVNYSQRIAFMKLRFTQLCPLDMRSVMPENSSRLRRREATIWQRRFYEHTIRDNDDFKVHLEYIHNNAVKHGYASCPHLWPYSSFHKWVKLGEYTRDWGCVCNGGLPIQNPRFDGIAKLLGE